MLKKDKLLQSFLEHEFINRKFDKKDLPKTVSTARNSNIPIIKAIAIIIDDVESGIAAESIYRKLTKMFNQDL